MIQRTLVVLSLLLAVPALAEDAKARAAREELERQLNQMVMKAPSRVRIDLASLDEPNYQLEEASFELDGRGLGSPSMGQLMREGNHLVWNGDVTPGKHTVKVLLVYANASSIVVSDEGGYKWRIGGAVSFDVQAGIEVHVTVTPSRDGAQPDVAKRFKLALPAKPVMLAKLDDGSMPEPVKPVVAVAVVDAGAAGPTAAELAAEAARLADAEKKAKAEAAAQEKQRLAAEAAEARRFAAEEKKRKAAEVAEAKRLAAEEKKRKAAEAAAYKKLSAAEKKRRAAEEAEAKKQAAAEEQQRLADERKGILRTAAEGNKPVAMAGQVDPTDSVLEDAGVEAVTEVLDAGALDASVTAVVAVTPDAGAPVAAATPIATPESEGPPWLFIGIGGGVLALALLVVLARRSARPPTIDD